MISGLVLALLARTPKIVRSKIVSFTSTTDNEDGGVELSQSENESSPIKSVVKGKEVKSITELEDVGDGDGGVSIYESLGWD